MREWLKAIVFALVLVLIVRLFLFQVFTVPTPSMEKTLLPGDFVFVSKVHYGARMPITLLSFPFVQQTLPFTQACKSYLDRIQFPYWRMPGFSEIKRNDVVVFNYPNEDEIPIDHRSYFVKRCVALPGDKLEIKQGLLYVNDTAETRSDKIQFNYHVKAGTTGINQNLLDSLDITEGGRISKGGDYSFSLTPQKAEALKKLPGIKMVKIFCEKQGSFAEYIFPNDDNIKWNEDWFGPLRVPKKNDSVQTDAVHLPLYKRIIEVHEHNKLEVRNDSVFINDKYSRYYLIKMNYYFMMGDNRHNSADSRFWGFVPENHIVGKAMYVLLSLNKGNSGLSRWNRWFTKIE